MATVLAQRSKTLLHTIQKNNGQGKFPVPLGGGSDKLGFPPSLSLKQQRVEGERHVRWVREEASGVLVF